MGRPLLIVYAAASAAMAFMLYVDLAYGFRYGFLPVGVFASLMGATTILHWNRFSHGHVAFWLWALLYFTTPFLIFWVWVGLGLLLALRR